MSETESIPSTPSPLLPRVLAGLGGGFLGTMITLLVMVFFLFANTDNQTIQNSDEFSDLVSLMMIFCGSLFSNVMSVFLLTVLNKEKYTKRYESLQYAFFSNIILFVVLIPFYIFLSDQQTILTISGVYIFLSACTSALICEIIAGKQYAISAAFGVSLVQMILLLIYLSLHLPINGTLITILFLPFIWIMIPIFIGVTEKILYPIQNQAEKNTKED